MIAIDKIYIWPMLNSSDGYVGIAWAEAHGGMEEYIRKDALLEWLNEKLYEHNEDRFDDGFNTALGQVIDKIESL